MADHRPRTIASRAKAYRDLILAAMKLLTDARLDELARRGDHSNVIDGYPSVTMGDGRGTGGDSVQSAVLRRQGFDPISPDDLPTTKSQADPVANVLNDLFDTLRQMAKDAARLERWEANLRFDRARAGDPVDPSDPAGRESSLQSACLACDYRPSGLGDDRLRRGLCPRCYRQWRPYAAGQEDPSMGIFLARYGPALRATSGAGVSPATPRSVVTSVTVAGVDLDDEARQAYLAEHGQAS